MKGEALYSQQENMHSQDAFIPALSWEALTQLSAKEENLTQGATNAQATLRLFGQSEENIRVILYRDHHAWCPYCQKVWLWLEWKKIPYKTRKVTMRCYGKKEEWFTRKVPSGMLPALELDGELITESDVILLKLEESFGSLGRSLKDPKVFKLRVLERRLFSTWCQWLCRPGLNKEQEEKAKRKFQETAREVEQKLLLEEGPWLDPTLDKPNQHGPGGADVIFIPYLERMNASLAYYKGLNIREEHPVINNWFEALEQLEEYRGTQGDMHTHAHDLPPQMGGCWVYSNPKQQFNAKLIDSGEGLGEQETSWSFSEKALDRQPQSFALSRVLKHRKTIMRVNPLGSEVFDQPLRASLTYMMLKEPSAPSSGSAIGLRYLRDRISVPRDMPLLAARTLRQALEKTAQIDSQIQGPTIPLHNRYDQNPEPFLTP